MLIRKRPGRGHGIRNHKHASGNGLVRWYYGPHQSMLNPKSARTRSRVALSWKEKQNKAKRNRKKQ